MKSEHQCLAKLEEVVNKLNAAAAVTAPEGAKPADENAQDVAAHIGALGILAWVLDNEAEFTGFLRQVELASLASRLGASGVKLPQA